MVFISGDETAVELDGTNPHLSISVMVFCSMLNGIVVA
jgi:hypothetical protein